MEFGTSFGVSTLWLAAAVRANGGGTVVGTELVPERARRAQQSIDEAGLADIVELRVGDALETLRELPGEIDLVLNDGFPIVALDILKPVAPRLREGAVVLTDNIGTFRANYRDYVAYLRDPAHGFASQTVPFKFGTEYSVRVRSTTP